jgi:hypothetical protein
MDGSVCGRNPSPAIDACGDGSREARLRRTMRRHDPSLGRLTSVAIAVGLALATAHRVAEAQDELIIGANTNIAGGPQALTVQPFFVRGDVLGKAQNEPSCAMSTRNPQHVFCGANDYRMVDVPGVSITSVVRDAWLGNFQSVDGGDTWESTLHPGFFLDPVPHVLRTENFRAAADPTVRSGPAGMTFYSGIAFSGPDRDEGAVFMSTFIDLNHREKDRMPFKFVRTVLVDRGNAGQFIDKPWTYVEANSATCTFPVALEDGTTVTQTVPGSTIHMLYSVFVGNSEVNVRTKEMYTRSTDCGATFTRPVKVSESVAVNNGATIAKPLVAGSNRVYGAWRRFSTPNGEMSNAIVSIVSNDNGATWTKAAVVAEMCPFDQVTKATQFRTTAFPTMTADASGRAYVLWADRGRDTATNACKPFGAARIMMSSSMDGIAWSAPQPVIPSATPEHQIFPAIAFTAGKLMLAWVDFKEDASQVFGQQVNEAEAFFSQSDRPPIRHTGDVRAAMASPGAVVDFLNDVKKVSRYLKGVGTVNGTSVVGQIQWNAFNRRWARKGAVPFDGDYIDIGTVPYLPPDPQAGRPGWTPNNGLLVPATPTVLIAWTDNRDMRRLPVTLPENLGVEEPPAVPYVTPLGLDLPPTSIYDATQSRPVCTPGVNNYATGTFNQNVYSAPATRAFVASSPANNKTLGAIQRAFVVVVRNDTDGLRQFQEVATQPAGGFASFDQFATNTSSIIVTVPRHSSVARTVFVTPNPASPTPLDPNAVVPVTVTEIVASPPGQSTTIFLGLGVQTPEIDGPEIDGPEIDGPEIDGPEIDGSALDTSAVTDFTYKVSNKGNTTAQVKGKAFVPGGPAGANYQVIVRRAYPVASVNQACEATTVSLSKVAVSILNTDVSSPEIDGSSLDTASFFIAPSETVDFVIRMRSATERSAAELTSLAQGVEIAVQQEAVNTADLALGITEPPVFTSFLSIADSQLPSGRVGLSYARALSVSGGGSPVSYSWNLVEGGTGLPTGLTFSAGGVIAGTPTAAGTFTLNVQVQHSGPPVQVATRILTLVITQSGTASLAFVAQPSDTGSGQAISPVPSVRAVNASGAPMPGVLVTLALGANPGEAALTGTSTATTGVTGVAVFPSLVVTNAGAGYTLAASAAGHGSATSVPFDVGAPTDLIVQSLTHSPETPTTANMITLTAVVKNAGNGSAGASTLLFKIGDETPGRPGTLFGVPSLASGATHTVQRMMMLGAQNYLNTATADFTGAVSEADETNNTTTDAYTVFPPLPLTFTVSNTSDSGPGSLRQALLDSNANAGFTDTIAFAIPGAAPHVITPLSGLPAINEPVLIDAAGAGGCSDAPPTVEIDGISAGLAHGLFVAGGGTTIRGLAITRFASSEFAGIFLAGGAGSVVQCSYVGLAPDGVTAKGNYDGVRIGGSFNNRIGGRPAAVRNVISGNLRNGVLIMGPLSVAGSGMQNAVLGNFIGTDASGTLDRGNAGQGVHIIRSAGNTIGGANAFRNVISGNGGEGLRIDGATATNNLVQGNYIGTNTDGAARLGNSASGVYIRRAPGNSVIGNVVSGNVGFAGIAICGNLEFCGGGDVPGVEGVPESNASGNVVQGNVVGRTADGSSALGNAGYGVSIDAAPNTTVGGADAGAGNVISANSVGVVVFGAPGSGNQVRHNSISGNTALGIDLGGNGVTANDAGDGDAGPNDLQNFPVLTSASTDGVTTTVTGSLNSTAATTFVVDFYNSPSCDPSNGEGATWIGWATYTTDASGNMGFTHTVGVPLSSGTVVTALATSPGNSTSEFSACVTVGVVTP